MAWPEAGSRLYGFAGWLYGGRFRWRLYRYDTKLPVPFVDEAKHLSHLIAPTRNESGWTFLAGAIGCGRVTAPFPMKILGNFAKKTYTTIHKKS